MVFAKVLIIVILATITLNIFKYARTTLNLKIPIRLYLRFLDYLNITYIIAIIISSCFENLKFLIPPKIGSISNIKKTIIFVNNIEKDIVLEKYL